MKPFVLVLSVVAIASAPAQTIPLAPDAAVQKAEAALGNAIASNAFEGTVAAYDAEGFTAGSAMPPSRGIAEFVPCGRRLLPIQISPFAVGWLWRLISSPD
jgi:hypothetical protein